ncbi:MAG: hydrolase [Acidobacteria bacterium]|nr:hydrolase [Acidobacteriota bacterium]
MMTSNAELPPLDPDEQTKLYSKYYRDPVPPDPVHLAKMDVPCDPSKAIYPDRMNDLLNPGGLEVETGWCNLPNGAGFIANRNVYKNVTAEMIDWWFAWHPLESMRYRIWYPPQHAGIGVSAESRERILDPRIPISEKNWGVTHHVVEDCNCGMENIDITFLSPGDFGFDMARWREPYVSTFAGGFGWSGPAEKTGRAIKAPSLMCHIFRQSPGGLEHRTRFWMGYRMSGGKPELCLPPGVSVPEKAIRGLARHNVHEFSNLAVLLPEIYEEFGGPMIS